MTSGGGKASRGIYGRVLVLTILGGLGFWAANFAVSLTPVAAVYRDALSISYFPMLLEALIGGLAIGLYVSFFLLRFYTRNPTGSPIPKICHAEPDSTDLPHLAGRSPLEVTGGDG